MRRNLPKSSLSNFKCSIKKKSSVKNKIEILISNQSEKKTSDLIYIHIEWHFLLKKMK